MSNNLEKSDKVFETYPVKGESLALWVPLLLALFGIISSIFIAQSLLFPDLKMHNLLTPKISKQYEQKTEKPASREVKKSSEDKTVEHPSKSFAAEINPSIKQTAQDIKSEKEMGLPAINKASFVDSDTINDGNESAPTESEYVMSEKTSATVSSVAEPEHFDDSAKITKTPEIEPMSEKGVETISAAVEPKPTLIQDCPSLFFFTFSRDSETPESHNFMPKIKRLNSWAEQHPDKKIFIEGHTDSYGPDEHNLLLSFRRAKAAEKILIEAGISKNQLIIRALGEYDPLPDQSTQSKKNRRASIRVEALQECINPLINGESN